MCFTQEKDKKKKGGSTGPVHITTHETVSVASDGVAELPKEIFAEVSKIEWRFAVEFLLEHLKIIALKRCEQYPTYYDHCLSVI